MRQLQGQAHCQTSTFYTKQELYLLTVSQRKRQEGPVLAVPSCLVQTLATSGFFLSCEPSDTCSPRDVGQTGIENVHCRLSAIQIYLLRLGQCVPKLLQQTDDYSSPKLWFFYIRPRLTCPVPPNGPFTILNGLRREEGLSRICPYSYPSCSEKLPSFPSPTATTRTGRDLFYFPWMDTAP